MGGGGRGDGGWGQGGHTLHSCRGLEALTAHRSPRCPKITLSCSCLRTDTVCSGNNPLRGLNSC